MTVPIITAKERFNPKFGSLKNQFYFAYNFMNQEFQNSLTGQFSQVLSWSFSLNCGSVVGLSEVLFS